MSAVDLVDVLYGPDRDAGPVFEDFEADDFEEPELLLEPSSDDRTAMREGVHGLSALRRSAWLEAVTHFEQVLRHCRRRAGQPEEREDR